MSNPYQSPAADLSPPPVPMSRVQRKSLEFYWKHREQSLSLGRLIRQSLPRWGMLCFIVISISAGSVAIGLFKRATISAMVLGMSGLLMGYLSRDVTHLRSISQLWPVLDEVFDRNAIQAKL